MIVRCFEKPDWIFRSVESQFLWEWRVNHGLVVSASWKDKIIVLSNGKHVNKYTRELKDRVHDNQCGDQTTWPGSTENILKRSTIVFLSVISIFQRTLKLSAAVHFQTVVLQSRTVLNSCFCLLWSTQKQRIWCNQSWTQSLKAAAICLKVLKSPKWEIHLNFKQQVCIDWK